MLKFTSSNFEASYLCGYQTFIFNLHVYSHAVSVKLDLYTILAIILQA